MATSFSVLVPPGGQRILVVLAHPDDAESYCGGTMARLATEGRDICYLVITRGDKGSDDPMMTPEQLVVIREQEQREAARVLGVQEVVFFEEYYDGAVEPTLSLREALTGKIRTWRPDVVFTFDPWKRYEIHPDHRATGICTYDAIAAARGWMNYPHQLQGETTEHKVKQVYFFNTDQPNHWVDIGDVLDTKIEARLRHVSQVQPANPPSGYLRRWAAETGVAAGYAFAEGFHFLGL